MTDQKKPILCGECHVAVEGPAKPDSEAIYACPTCGNADNFENVMASVKAFTQEFAARHMQKLTRDALGSSKFIKMTMKPIPQRSYPFIADLKL